MDSESDIDILKLKRTPIVDRVNYLLEKCQDKSVLHLGCVDSPFLEARIHNEELLHQKIMKSNVAGLWGVDIDTNGIRTMRDHLKIDNLYVGNIEILEDIDLGKKVFDVVLAPEIIEHINSPGLFMQKISDFLHVNGQLVITVPSALNLKIFFHGILGREKVHADHNYYFSPSTLKHFIESNGFEVLEMYPYWCPPRTGFLGLLDRTIGLFGLVSPWVGEGIVVSAKKTLKPKEEN